MFFETIFVGSWDLSTSAITFKADHTTMILRLVAHPTIKRLCTKAIGLTN